MGSQGDSGPIFLVNVVERIMDDFDAQWQQNRPDPHRAA